MESEISFTIHWVWIIWTFAVISAIALIGGISYVVGHYRGEAHEESRQKNIRTTGIGR